MSVGKILYEGVSVYRTLRRILRQKVSEFRADFSAELAHFFRAASIAPLGLRFDAFRLLGKQIDG